MMSFQINTPGWSSARTIVDDRAVIAVEELRRHAVHCLWRDFAVAVVLGVDTLSAPQQLVSAQRHRLLGIPHILKELVGYILVDALVNLVLGGAFLDELPQHHADGIACLVKVDTLLEPCPDVEQSWVA